MGFKSVGVEKTAQRNGPKHLYRIIEASRVQGSVLIILARLSNTYRPIFHIHIYKIRKFSSLAEPIVMRRTLRYGTGYYGN